MKLKAALTEADIRAEDSVEALHGEIEQLYKDQGALKLKLEASLQQLTEKEEENQFRLAKLQEEHRQRELELQSKLDDAKRSASENLAHAVAEISALQHQIKAMESSRHQLQREKSVLADSLQAEIANTLTFVEQAESLQQKRLNLEADLDALKQAHSDARHRHDELIAAKEKERQQNLATIEELRQANQKLAETTRQDQANYQILQERMEQALEAERQHSKDEQTRLEAVIEETNRKLQLSHTETQQQLDEARQQAQTGSQILLGRMNKVIEAEKQTARREQACLKSVIKKLKQQLETSREETHRQRDEWQHAREEHKRLESEIEGLNQQLDDARQQAQSDARELQERMNQKLELDIETEKQYTREEKVRLETVIEGLKKKLQAIRTEINEERELRIVQEALLEQERQNTKELKHRLAETNITLISSNKRLADIERTRQETLAELKKELEANENAWSTVTDSEIEVQMAKQETSSLRIVLEEQITNLRAQLEHQQGSSDTILKRHQEENDQLKQSLDKMQAQLKMADSTIRLLKESQNTKSKTKSQLEDQLSKLQVESRIKQAELTASVESERKEKESLLQQLEIAKAQSEDPGALQQANEEISILKRKIKGMREVHLEMENHQNVEKNENTRKMLNDLKMTQAKLKKTEKLAQRSEVLLKENQVHESAIALLSEELDELTKEKELLLQERDKLTKELNDIKEHYIKLGGENGRLH